MIELQYLVGKLNKYSYVLKIFRKFLLTSAFFCKNWIKNFFCLLGTITSEKIKCLNLCVHIKKSEGKKTIILVRIAFMKIKIGIAMGRQKCKNYSHNIVLQLA